MRVNSDVFNEFNQASLKDLRLVVKLGFPTPYYITSHSGIPNIPAGALEDSLKNLSSTSQRLVPDEGRSEIGAMSFEAVDVGGAVTTEIRSQQAAGNGLKGITVELYRGGAGMDWTDFRIEQTQQIDRSVTFSKGAYKFQCRDIQREMRKDFFDLAKTRLAAQLTAGATTLTVFDTSDFEACSHVASFGDEPSGSFYYLKLKYNNGFEIIKATGKTATTFTGLTRGMFGTDDVTHALPSGSDADSGVEVEEYVYVELPAPAMAYALLTGNIIGGGTIPTRWHLGISTALVDQSSFEDIGDDWFDSSDYSKGLIFRFQSLSKTDGKRFIEREVCLLAGAFLRVGADGKLYMRRMTGIIGNADYVAEIGVDNAIAHGPVKHELSRIRNNFDIEWSYVHFPGESKPRFVRRNILVDATSIAIHGEGKPLALQFKGLHNERHTYTTLINRFDAFRDRYAGPPITFPVDLLPSLNDFEVGDIVRAVFPNVRDYSGSGTLDRSFETQRITINQKTGRVSAQLFGSTLKADPIADAGAGATSELPDSWYSTTGTEMGTLLSIDGSGILQADGTLNGGTTTRTVFYYLGDFTIPAGLTLTVTGNVELRIRGHFQINGTLAATTGMPSDTAGFFGIGLGGRTILIKNGVVTAIPGPGTAATGREVLPVTEIENSSGTLVGVRPDMRGSGGARGGHVREWQTSAFVTVASGGAGGVGGGSVVTVSRGAGYGVAGETVLSGTDGSTGAQYSGEQSGSGGGGSPGTLLHLLDGSQVTFPILAGNVIALYGTSPIGFGNADTQGKAKASDPIDLGEAAARVAYVPASRDAFPDEENENLATVFYYIKPLNGAAIHNGTGTLTIEAHKVTAGSDVLLAAGTIRLYDPSNNEITVANGYAAGSDGFTGVFDSGDIAGDIVITLKDGAAGAELDTITLVDIADGTAGTPGADGVDAVYGFIEPENGLAWTRATNAGAWTPSQATTDLDCTFVQAGAVVARIARRVTLNTSDGTLTVSTVVHKGGDLNTSRVSVTVTGSASTAVTVQFDYSFSGETASVAETAKTAQGGDDGSTGAAGADGTDGTLKEFVFKRALSQPATPTGSGIPAGWSDDPPGGSDPLWMSTAEQELDGTLIGVWSVPRRMDGSAGSSAMNVNRRMNSLEDWWANATQTTLLSAGSIYSIQEVAGPVWGTVLRGVENTAGNGPIFSERMTIDPTKKHRVSVWARQTAGDRKNYLLVCFYDNTGAVIPGSGNAVNWTGQGTYFYWQLVNSVFPSDWTLYQFDFGGDAAANIPSSAVSMAIGGLLLWTGTTSTTVELQDYFVVELADDGGTGPQGDTGPTGPAGPGIPLLPLSFLAEAIGTLPQTATITFHSTGTMTVTGSTGVKWYTAGPETDIGDGFQVRCKSASVAWDSSAAAIGTWITIGVSRTWSMQRTVMEGAGSDVNDGVFEIRPVGEVQILTQGTGSAEAADA